MSHKVYTLKKNNERLEFHDDQYSSRIKIVYTEYGTNYELSHTRNEAREIWHEKIAAGYIY